MVHFDGGKEINSGRVRRNGHIAKVGLQAQFFR